MLESDGRELSVDLDNVGPLALLPLLLPLPLALAPYAETLAFSRSILELRSVSSDLYDRRVFASSLRSVREGTASLEDRLEARREERLPRLNGDACLEGGAMAVAFDQRAGRDSLGLDLWPERTKTDPPKQASDLFQ